MTLLLLAALTVGAIDEWRPYSANPAYEVLGHMDQGVFRYSQSRLKDRAKNFGLSMPAKDRLFEANDFEVSGTDRDLGETIARAALNPAVAIPAPPIVAKESAGDDCRRPKPDPLPKIPERVAWETGDIVLVSLVAIVGVFFGVFLLAIKLVLLFLLARWLYRWLTAPPASNP